MDANTGRGRLQLPCLKGHFQTLPGQTHNVAFEALAPVLISFLTQRSACNVPTGEADVPNINKV